MTLIHHSGWKTNKQTHIVPQTDSLNLSRLGHSRFGIDGDRVGHRHPLLGEHWGVERLSTQDLGEKSTYPIQQKLLIGLPPPQTHGHKTVALWRNLFYTFQQNQGRAEREKTEFQGSEDLFLGMLGLLGRWFGEDIRCWENSSSTMPITKGLGSLRRPHCGMSVYHPLVWPYLGPGPAGYWLRPKYVLNECDVMQKPLLIDIL